MPHDPFLRENIQDKPGLPFITRYLEKYFINDIALLMVQVYPHFP
jgi:hypothetical protein